MTFTIVAQIREGLDRIASVVATDDGAIATTHCLYPSNGFVRVRVRIGHSNAIVSDNGGAWGEALSAGIPNLPDQKQLQRWVTDRGLLTDKSRSVISPPVSFDEIPAAIVLVANTSRDVAETMYANAHLRPKRDFKQALSKLLELTFQKELAHEFDVQGKHVVHTFSNVIKLSDERRLIVDPVLRDPSSINSRVVSNLDVRQAGNPLILQAMVYDDEEDWNPDDLRLLSMADVPAIAFSRSIPAIRQLAIGRG
jgi:hypothetical protein